MENSEIGRRLLESSYNFKKSKEHGTRQYSESQIYEYIARVFYNVVFSTYLGSNAAEK